MYNIKKEMNNVNLMLRLKSYRKMAFAGGHILWEEITRYAKPKILKARSLVAKASKNFPRFCPRAYGGCLSQTLGEAIR